MKIDPILHPVTLESSWVRLEPLRLHHLEALWEVADDPRVYEHLPVRFKAKHDMERFILDSLRREDADSSLPFAIWSKADNRFVGSSALFDFSDERRAMEIGWTWHTPAVWGTKINLATKFLLLEHGFERLDLVRIYLKTDINNGRSQRAIEKLGAKREGVWRKHMKRPDGTWRDSIFYSILDDEWPVVKRALEERLN